MDKLRRYPNQFEAFLFKIITNKKNKKIMAKKLSFERMIEIMQEVNPKIQLLDEFRGKNGKPWCHYICECGNKTEKSWNDLQQGKKCMECSKCRPLSFEERVGILKERNPNVILLEVERGKNGKAMCTFKTTFDETIRKSDWSNLTARLEEPEKTKEERIMEYKKQIIDGGFGLDVYDFFTKEGENVGGNIYLKYKCKCGNILTKALYRILKGEMCIKCPRESNMMSIEERMEKLREVGKDDIIIYSQRSVDDRSLVVVKCSCGNIEERKWGDVLRSKGCGVCNGNKKLTLEERRENLKSIGSEMIIIDEFFKNGDWWCTYKCTCGREHKKTWDHLRTTVACPNCYSSKGENKINKWLTKNEINFKQFKTFEDLRSVHGTHYLSYDFYLPDFNLLIEYDGEYHFMPITKNKEKAEENFEKQKRRDELKTNYAKNNNIKLLRIPYTEFKNVENILENEIFGGFNNYI